MEWYKYAKDTGEYSGPVKLAKDPLNQWQFYTVDNATPNKPPNSKAGFVVCWSAGNWIYKEDHRGKTVYSKKDQSKKKIEDIGPIPVTHTVIEPKHLLDRWDGEKWQTDKAALLDHAATQKLNEINTQADTLLEPITSKYPKVEVLSWDKQETEARSWQHWIDTGQNGPEPPTRHIDSILVARTDKDKSEPSTDYIDNILVTRTDVDKPQLVRRIITKADAYTMITGQITGIRHNLEKKVEDIQADNTLTDDEKRAAIEAIDVQKAYSIVKP